jgi:hypothetical protein
MRGAVRVPDGEGGQVDTVAGEDRGNGLVGLGWRGRRLRTLQSRMYEKVERRERLQESIYYAIGYVTMGERDGLTSKS